MSTSSQSPHPSMQDLDQVKTQKEIDKLTLEIAELVKSRRRFNIGSVGVPLLVAFVTLAIFGATGFFDTHERLIEIAKHDFKDDTAAFAKIKAVIFNQIVSLRNDSLVLRDTIAILKNKVHVYDSLISFIHKNANGQDKAMLKLADSISYLRIALSSQQAIRQETSDSVKSLTKTIMEMMGRISVYEGKREYIYDLQKSNEYYSNENNRLQHKVDSLLSIRK